MFQNHGLRADQEIEGSPCCYPIQGHLGEEKNLTKSRYFYVLLSNLVKVFLGPAIKHSQISLMSRHKTF